MCKGCGEPGWFNSGWPGIIAHVVKNRVLSRVERCDVCEVYESDKEAYKALISLLAARFKRKPHGTFGLKYQEGGENGRT